MNVNNSGNSNSIKSYTTENQGVETSKSDKLKQSAQEPLQSLVGKDVTVTSSPYAPNAKQASNLINTQGTAGTHKISDQEGGLTEVKAPTKNEKSLVKDVRTLGGEEFAKAEKAMRKFDTFLHGGEQMISTNSPSIVHVQRDGDNKWVGLRSDIELIPKGIMSNPQTKDKGLTEEAIVKFNVLKTKLINELGFEAIQGKGGGFIHKDTGMRIAVMYNPHDKEMSIYFSGLGASVKKDQGLTTRLGEVIKESLGGKAKSTAVCIGLGNVLKELNKDDGIKLSVAGHSHGGNLAQVVSLTAGIPAVCFNSRCISATTQQMIKNALQNKNDVYTKNSEGITHFNKEGCWVSDNRALNAIIKLIGKIKGDEAMRVGEQFSVPSNRKGSFARHNDTSWPEDIKPNLNNRVNAPSMLTQRNMDPIQMRQALGGGVNEIK